MDHVLFNSLFVVLVNESCVRRLSRWIHLVAGGDVLLYMYRIPSYLSRQLIYFNFFFSQKKPYISLFSVVYLIESIFYI